MHTIKSALSNNYYPLSFDLKAGYHNFDIFPIYHKYLAFSWDFGAGYVRYFHFHGSTFGLSGTPFIFTELLKPLGTHLRGQGIPIAMFSDDDVRAGESLNSAKINSSIVRAGVSRCGFKINKEKSN